MKSEIQLLIYEELMAMRLEVYALKEFDHKNVDAVLSRYHEQLGKKITIILDGQDIVGESARKG